LHLINFRRPSAGKYIQPSLASGSGGSIALPVHFLHALGNFIFIIRMTVIARYRSELMVTPSHPFVKNSGGTPHPFAECLKK
jgi:hypothetical protein